MNATSLVAVNRMNTMIYRENNNTIIRTSLKSIKVKMSDDEHYFLKNFLIKTQQGKVVDTQNSREMKIIKLLLKSGSVFLIDEDSDEYKYTNKNWFYILSQYLPTNYSLIFAMQSILNFQIYIDNDLYHKIPNLKETFTYFDLEINSYNQNITKINNKKTLLITDKINLLNCCENAIFIQFDNYKLIGTALNKNLFECSGILESRIVTEFSSNYLVIYALKVICGIHNDYFVFNKDGDFIEKDYTDDNFIRLPLNYINNDKTYPKDMVKRIIGLEKEIPIYFPEISIANQYSKFGKFKQLGLSAFGLKIQSKKELIFIGKSYENAAYKAFIEGLNYYLNTYSENWLVCSNESYYEEKIYKLLDYVKLKYKYYKFDISKSKIYQSYKSFFNNLEIIIKHHNDSKSSIVYIINDNNKMFSDNKRCFDIIDKINELLISYLFYLENKDKKINSLYFVCDCNFYNNKMDYFDIKKIPSRKTFIEINNKFLATQPIKYKETVMDKEEKLKNSGILIRYLEVSKDDKFN